MNAAKVCELCDIRSATLLVDIRVGVQSKILCPLRLLTFIVIVGDLGILDSDNSGCIWTKLFEKDTLIEDSIGPSAVH
jgi:hypothetical protein